MSASVEKDADPLLKARAMENGVKCVTAVEKGLVAVWIERWEVGAPSL
jgi:hypothetical protein